jgi:hypothetical protein
MIAASRHLREFGYVQAACDYVATAPVADRTNAL